MVCTVEEYVYKTITDFAGCSQFSTVPSVRKDLAVSSKMPIHCFGQPNHKSLHPAAQRFVVIGLDHEMQMLELNGIVGYAERAAIGFLYCGLNHWVQTSKGWERSTDSKRRMHGMVALVLFSWEMGHTRQTWV